MITRLKQENNMKKLVYIATIASSMLLTTSCVDLTQEPQSFITEEEFIARMDVTALQQATSALYLDLWGGQLWIQLPFTTYQRMCGRYYLPCGKSQQPVSQLL